MDPSVSSGLLSPSAIAEQQRDGGRERRDAEYSERGSEPVPEGHDVPVGDVRAGDTRRGGEQRAGNRDVAHQLGEQELLFVLPPDAMPRGGRALGARELAQTPLVVSPPGTSTRILLEQALTAVGVTPRIAVETAAREAIVPLVLAGAGAALLPAPLALEAQRRGATVRAVKPKITRAVGLVHRASRLSPTAAAFLALAGVR